MSITKRQALKRAHTRVRKKVEGSSARPRLSIHRSGAHIYAQIIDDEKQITLVSSSSLDFKADSKGSNTEAASLVGQALAKKAREKQIEAVVCDRGGHRFHGRVKALADAAREGGLTF